jgi:hypothetical protein
MSRSATYETVPLSTVIGSCGCTWTVRDSKRHVYISTANTLIQIQPASMTGLAKMFELELLALFHIYFRRITPLIPKFRLRKG